MYFIDKQKTIHFLHLTSKFNNFTKKKKKTFKLWSY